jgi:vesicle transport protein SEC22
MVQLTWVFLRAASPRVDPLTLVADQGGEAELERRFRERAKAIAAAASGERGSACEVVTDAGHYYLYVSDELVVYVVLCEAAYERRLALDYLREVAREFRVTYSADEIRRAVRPYEFTAFDHFLQKTKRLYLDPRSERNMQKLAHELGEVHSLMTRNLEDVLHRGAKIQTVQQRSEKLLVDSGIYSKRAKQLNLQRWWMKALPLLVIAAGALLLIGRYIFF